MNFSSNPLPEEGKREWFKEMRSFHIVPQEFVGHMDHKCPPFFQARPIKSAFGKR